MYFFLDKKVSKNQERKLAYRQAGIYSTFLSFALLELAYYCNFNISP
jgi:hypothetical protein